MQRESKHLGEIDNKKKIFFSYYDVYFIWTQITLKIKTVI